MQRADEQACTTEWVWAHVAPWLTPTEHVALRRVNPTCSAALEALWARRAQLFVRSETQTQTLLHARTGTALLLLTVVTETRRTRRHGGDYARQRALATALACHVPRYAWAASEGAAALRLENGFVLWAADAAAAPHVLVRHGSWLQTPLSVPEAALAPPGNLPAWVAAWSLPGRVAMAWHPNDDGWGGGGGCNSGSDDGTHVAPWDLVLEPVCRSGAVHVYAHTAWLRRVAGIMTADPGPDPGPDEAPPPRQQQPLGTFENGRFFACACSAGATSRVQEGLRQALRQAHAR